MRPLKQNRDSRDGGFTPAWLPAESVASANAYLGTVASSLQAKAPDTNTGITFEAGLLKDSLAGESKLLLQLLALGAAIVLCVAYFNAYQLLAAKVRAATLRWNICLALGASPKRIFQDMFKEPLFLSLIGCSIGLGLSLLGIHSLRILSPADIPHYRFPACLAGNPAAFVLSILAAALFTLLMLHAHYPWRQQALSMAGADRGIDSSCFSGKRNSLC